MRRFIFILMIALLPLRGWMGEAMATEMSAMYLIASQATNTMTTADINTDKSMSDCDMHKTVKLEHTQTKPTCTHCQACHATGLVSTVQITSFNQVQYAQPLAQASQFASATIAHSQKPPIL
jgi:RNase P subunit RPR2